MEKNVEKLLDESSERKKPILSELEKFEKEIEENSDDLYNSLSDEVYHLYDKSDDVNYEEMNKYSRLNSSKKRMEEKIKSSKAKEYAIIVAFLLANAKRMQTSILEETGLDADVLSEADLLALISMPLDGLTLGERFGRTQMNLILKSRESLVKAVVDKRAPAVALKDIRANVNSSKSATISLLETKHTQMDYLITVAVVNKLKNKMVVYNATFDNTCDNCASLHGKEYHIDNAPSLPMHFRCKCFYTSLNLLEK